MADALLPCPFCGLEPEPKASGGRTGWYIYYCPACCAKGPPGEDAVDARDEWNCRAGESTPAGHITVLTRQAEDARAMHLASVAALTGLIEALAPLVKLDPEGEVGEWAEKIDGQIKDLIRTRDRAQEDLILSRQQVSRLEAERLDERRRNGALIDQIEDERARADGLRRTLALVSGAPRRMDATWDELVDHIGTLRPPTDLPALTEAEMEARAAAWEERADRIHRIEALRPDVTIDPMAAEEREAAIERHHLRIAELTRFALTGVR